MDTVDALVRRAQDHDAPFTHRHDAFAELVRRFQDLAYGYAYALLGDAHLAHDAAQEAFLSAYRQLPQLRDPDAFPGWLRRVVRTHCRRLQRCRGTGLVALEGDADAPELGVSDQDPAVVVERRETQELVAAAIQELPDRERVVMVLFYLRGYRQQDVAEFLGVPVTTIKKRLQAARKRMQEGMLDVVRDTLQHQGPSGDDRFVETIQFVTACEAVAGDGEQLLVEMLLLDGLDVNARDKDGRTLLCLAAQRGHLDAVELLLQRGADASAPDKTGKTAEQWAASRGYRKVADVLRRRSVGE